MVRRGAARAADPRVAQNGDCTLANRRIEPVEILPGAVGEPDPGFHAPRDFRYPASVIVRSARMPSSPSSMAALVSPLRVASVSLRSSRKSSTQSSDLLAAKRQFDGCSRVASMQPYRTGWPSLRRPSMTIAPRSRNTMPVPTMGTTIMAPIPHHCAMKPSDQGASMPPVNANEKMPL